MTATTKTTLAGLIATAGFTLAAFLLFLNASNPPPALTVREGSSPYFSDSVTVAPGSALFFTWGVTPSPRAKAIARGETGEPGSRYGDTYAQARALMTQLTDDLREVGLSLRDVVAVRANLVAEPELDMEGWNKAFSEFFGNATNPHKPARTTIGISRLFHPDYLAEVEFVAVFPPGRGPFVEGSRFERLYERLDRASTNDRVRSYGRPTWALSTGKAIQGGSALYFQSAMFPDPMMPNMATMPLRMRMYRGDVATQAEVIFKKQVAALQEAGLTPGDAFFSRNILYPDPKNGGRMDFAGFNTAYHAIYNKPENPNRLARTVMSAPGYVQQGQLLTIETYAVYPGDASKRFVKEDGTRLPLLAFRSDAKATAASGVATSPEAALTFVSGLIATERGTIKQEATEIFAQAKDKLAAAGATLDHVAQLRAYVVAGANGGIAATEFEGVYTATFTGDHRPALTILPVRALANGAKVEVELIAATLPN